MALSKPWDQSITMSEWYFYLVFQKYGIAIPEDASWKEMDKASPLNDHTQMCQEISNMLFEIVDLFENARVEELVKKCERLRLNSGNLYSHFTNTINTLLDNGLTWGKVVMFFSFAVSFTIYLCTNEMSHLAGRVCVWTAQDLQNRIQPWIDVNGGWVSNCMCMIHRYECVPI